MLLILFTEGKGSIWNRDRFNTEFKSEEAPAFKTRMPEEFKELITGNNDDCFRVGIALSKKVLKLYEAFDKSDFILCSPLGLRMILDGEAGKESHLISSIQIAVIDKADIMLQQNWEHLSIIFSHMHSQPSRIDTDISRVRQCYVDGQAKFYCQLLLFSRYRHELFSALMLEHSLNYRGLVMQNSLCEGTLDKIEIPLCQEFRRFDVTDPSEQAVARFNCFKDYCNASLSPGTCIVIPSYFDFVRVRNHFKRMEESFVACHEYAPKTKITRARDLFFHKTKKVLIVTERYYYFNRRPLRTNLAADWNPSDFSVFTCMGDPYPVRQDLEPIINDLKGRNASFDPKKDVVYHKCMSEKIEYYDSPPLRGDHRPNWARYGEYLYVPEQRWLHNLEHGSIILLYHPCADRDELEKLRHIVTNCLYRHIITPYKKLKHDRPLALVSWGIMMGMSSVNDTAVVDFIKEHARSAPEDISKNGVYDWYLIRPADVVSDDMDNHLCPGM
ncbi:hypothetical protein OESDEN_14673 [Oesophagostomum dentatum]|uniref:Digestive organ expansion factor-like protein n=1 Tax=Oesophagostomum dentatum TaxID=61180 RepID=A0A0B1SNY9_OESDE|nr:hypothetical protein OESDEN_14673 [Oesophagostomum dentatum]